MKTLRTIGAWSVKDKRRMAAMLVSVGMPDEELVPQVPQLGAFGGNLVPVREPFLTWSRFRDLAEVKGGNASAVRLFVYAVYLPHCRAVAGLRLSELTSGGRRFLDPALPLQSYSYMARALARTAVDYVQLTGALRQAVGDLGLAGLDAVLRSPAVGELSGLPIWW